MHSHNCIVCVKLFNCTINGADSTRCKLPGSLRICATCLMRKQEQAQLEAQANENTRCFKILQVCLNCGETVPVLSRWNYYPKNSNRDIFMSVLETKTSVDFAREYFQEMTELRIKQKLVPVTICEICLPKIHSAELGEESETDLRKLCSFCAKGTCFEHGDINGKLKSESKTLDQDFTS